MASKIRTVQKNRKKMVTEELKAVIAERDAAVEKVIKRRYFLFCKQQQKLTLNIWQGSLEVIPSILLYSFLVMIFFMFFFGSCHTCIINFLLTILANILLGNVGPWLFVCRPHCTTTGQ